MFLCYYENNRFLQPFSFKKEKDLCLFDKSKSASPKKKKLIIFNFYRVLVL